MIDSDPQRLAQFAGRYDVRTVEGDGTSKQVVRNAGVERADLFIGCSPREEANLVCAMLVKRLSRAQTIIRTTSAAYLEAWRERELDIDFMVSPELETANAIATILGMPAARHTDVFAEGKVQIVEFDVPREAARNGLIGVPAAARADPGRLEAHGARPRRPDDRPAWRRGDPPRRPHHRRRVAGRRARRGAGS